MATGAQVPPSPLRSPPPPHYTIVPRSCFCFSLFFASHIGACAVGFCSFVLKGSSDCGRGLWLALLF
eukprot:scaffold283128_cov33-Tisochrysis_lutea.AAC.1